MESVNEVEENYIDQLKRKSSDNKTLEDESDFCEKNSAAKIKGIICTDRKAVAKSVHFPDENNIISGYNEAPNPWADAHTNTTKDLIQGYVESCEKAGIKPIERVILQLEEVEDFSIRASSLTLKGENIDLKVAETLESVLRKVQFLLIDLEATNLNDDSAVALFEMFEYYESAVNVLIGFNKNIGPRGWQAAAHMMRKMSCLRLFDAHSVPLSSQATPIVCRALRCCHTLVTLHLENSSLSGRPMQLLVAGLRMNISLRELFLADNQLITKDAMMLSSLFTSNSYLCLLDIRNNSIQDAGVIHLCNGLSSDAQVKGDGGIQTLVLWNNQISHQCLDSLASVLKTSTSLCTLNLGQNYLGDEGATKIKEGLLKSKSVVRLGLVGTKITCEGAIAIAEFLVESSRIIRLDLRNNNIKVAGLMALSLAAKMNRSLFRLDIDKPSSKNTIKELAEKQESLLKDIEKYVTRNKQNALKKMQQDKPIRYMDLTSSTEQSNNCSNNNSEMGGKQFKIEVDSVDDSPINSPELLPINVSYHQVSPVIISSSEMEKRAVEQEARDHVSTSAPSESSETRKDTEVKNVSLEEFEKKKLDAADTKDAIGDCKDLKVESKEDPDDESSKDLIVESKEDFKDESSKDLKVESSEDLKVESSKDLEVESSEDLKVESKEDLKDESSEDLKIESKEDLTVESSKDLKVESSKDLKVESIEDLIVESEEDLEVESSKDLIVESEEDLEVESSKDLKVESKEDLKVESKEDLKEESSKDLKVESIEDLKVESSKDLKVESSEDLKVESVEDLEDESKEDLKVESKEDLKDESKEDLKVESIEDLKVESKEDLKDESKKDLKVESIEDLKVESIEDLKVESSKDLKVESVEDLKDESKEDLTVESIEDLKVESSKDHKVESSEDLKVEPKEHLEVESNEDEKDILDQNPVVEDSSY